MLGVPEAHLYRTHDLRRGHAQAWAARLPARSAWGSAQNMLEWGQSHGRMVEILNAGQWRSPAFLQCISTLELEAGAVLEVR